MISGLVTALLLSAFLCIVLWAWSVRNRPRWQAASQLPLQDEPRPPACGCGHNRTGCDGAPS